MFDLFLGEPIAFAVFWTLIGLLVGSFLNVVIGRLPIALHAYWEACEKQPLDDLTPVAHWLPKLWRPASSCPKCGHRIRWYENVPVLSWLFLRAKCSACGTPISVRYPIVEILGALAALAAALAFGPTGKALAATLLLWVLIALTMIDLDTMQLPDVLTLPLMWAGLLLNVTETFIPLASAVIGAAAGYLSLWLVYWLFRLVAHKEGMGYGDFKLLAALGAWMGWQMLPAIILLSSVVGAAVGIVMIAGRRLGWSQPLGFGPYLAGAGVLALFLGPQINHWYLGLLR
jgi:leader peptidase (prepilin peptidase) / N-methyltransferase